MPCLPGRVDVHDEHAVAGAAVELVEGLFGAVVEEMVRVVHEHSDRVEQAVVHLRALAHSLHAPQAHNSDRWSCFFVVLLSI